MEDFTLVMKGITKRFPGVLALDNVTFEVKRGEVHALIGENGAGKSTLMNVLGGVISKDSGEIYVNGKLVNIKNPHHSQELGISIIHQHSTLALNLNVAQNIFLGREPSQYGKIDWDRMYKETETILAEYNIEVDPRMSVRKLGVATRQMIEIAKYVSVNAQIVVMDEPTAPLTTKETDQLMSLIKDLKRRGISVIYISHRLEEVFRIADRATILRDGSTVGTVNVAEATSDEIVRMMVGHKVSEVFERENRPTNVEVLRIENLSTPDKLKNVSMSVRKGEILGIAGLMGSGRTELARAIFGADKKSGGQIYISGKAVNIDSPEDAIRHGIGFLTEDRDGEGLVLERSISSNITLSIVDRLCRCGVVNLMKKRSISEEFKLKLNIKTPSLRKLVRTLSGGNKQKVVLSKWLCTKPKIMILDEPTQGIDIGAKEEIYRIISDLASEGMAIIFISSELREIMMMSDHIVVMRDGEVVGDISGEEASKEKILKLVTNSK